MQALEGEKEKTLVALQGEACGCAELLPTQRIFDGLALHVGRRRIERLTGLQRLAERERVARIKIVVAEKTVGAAVHDVRAGLRDDVDGRAARAAKFGRGVGDRERNSR